MAGSDLARWCSSRCSMRAYYRRRRGAPEADPGVCRVIRPQVVQSELVSDPDELPAEWAVAAARAQGLECRSWNGTAIQRRESDGYVNATAMCQANGVRWIHFRQSAQCKAYMQALATEDGISVFDLVASQRGGSGAGGSTWIHADLATELARWISPAFSVFINRWFRSELEAMAAAAQLPPPRHEPQLPKLPPSGPAILIRAKTRREAAQIWCDTLALAASGSIRRCYSTLHRGPDVNSVPCGQWQHLPG